MDSIGLFSCILGMLSLAGGIIGVFVTHEKKMALNRQEIIFLKEVHNKLEVRVNELEDKLMDKVDIIMNKLEAIHIQIAKK